MTYLSNSDFLCFIHEDSCLDSFVDNVSHESDSGHQQETEPEHGAGEQHLKHEDHVGSPTSQWPKMRVDEQECEPDQDAAPDTEMTWQCPGIHLHASLQTCCDHHQAVHSVTQDQVAITGAMAPGYSNFHGTQWQPEQ